jgi:2-methylcitrate dehydratase PrpD
MKDSYIHFEENHMTIAQELVKNVSVIKFTDFDTKTIEYAKLRIMDTIGALIGGVNSSGVDMMLDLVKTWGGRDESSLLGIGGKCPAANAVLVTGIAARSNDLEPGGGPEIKGKRSPGHYSATTVPTAFAMAEKTKSSGKDLITALVLGDDLASRIGAAGAGPWDLGWDPAGTCSRFGSAVIAGKLMGLNEEQMLNALGIVFMQISGTMLSVMEYTHCAKISQGLSGWNGIMSAELAKRGFTGPSDPLMGQFGYYQQFCREFDTKIITSDLGKIFFGDEEFKVYPCCRGNASSVETALKLVRENEIDPDEIEDIYIDLSPIWKGSFLVQPLKIGSCVQISGILNLNYNVASAILRKTSQLENYTEEAILDPKVHDLSKKIKINPTVPGNRMSCRIRVKMKDNREYSAFTEVPRGDYHVSPLTKDEVKGKFRASANFSKAINREKVEKAIYMLERLEQLDNLTDLVAALIPDKIAQRS